MAPRPRCPVCRSKRWHRDTLSGSIVCEEGHLLAGYVQESTEQDYASQHVQQTRRERKNKTRKEKPPSNDHFHGERSTFLIWQCMQLILREQLRILIDELGWPVELEAVTRDLFALLVASSKVPPAPFDYDKGQEPAGSYSGPRPGDRYTKRGRTKHGPRGGPKIKKPLDSDEDEPGAGEADTSRTSTIVDPDQQAGDTTEAGGSDSSGESSPSSYFSDADDERPRPGGRSRRNSPVTSNAPSPTSRSLANDTTTSTSNPYNPPQPRPPLHGAVSRLPLDPRTQPRLDYLLYLIYLGCVTLRLPVFLSDIFHLAETYQIPYLDAAAHLPLEMQLHLSLANRRILSPMTLTSLTPPPAQESGRLSGQAWLARLVNMFREDWDVEFPEANLPLISGRLCRLLALPPIAHVLALRLLSFLPQPISFHLPTQMALNLNRSLSPRNAALAGSSRREKGLPPEFSWSARLAEPSQDWRLILPELKVASVLIVVAKMLWKVEGDGTRSETFLGEYAGNLPELKDWVATVQAIANLEKPGDPSKLWRNEAESMQSDEIDAYLDFFESKIVSKTKVPKRMADLGRFFPEPSARSSTLERATPETYTSRLDSLIASLYSSSASSQPSSVVEPTQYPAHPSSTSADSIPLPLSRVLVAICSHILPIPTSLPMSLHGAAPSLSSNSIAYFLPQVTLVERLLAIRSVPSQRQADGEARTEERRLWNETKTLAQECVRDQWDTEKARRKEIDKRIRDLRDERQEEGRRKKREKRPIDPNFRRKGKRKTKVTIGDSSEEEIEAQIREELGEFKSKSVVETSDEEAEEQSSEDEASEGRRMQSEDQEADDDMST
ncbi:uncharacterized protein JCM6883_004018 [Sporobolomyces salmoneus]|uniref:uncharacterized protein n=1 Tax=Sporobolomyces salmoneus TaxID=183962 RepID=UPI00316E95E8